MPIYLRVDSHVETGRRVTFDNLHRELEQQGAIGRCTSNITRRNAEAGVVTQISFFGIVL